MWTGDASRVCIPSVSFLIALAVERDKERSIGRAPFHKGKSMRYVICTVAFVVLAACTGPNADFDKGPVILQCDGESTTVVMGPPSTRKLRHHFKIDAKQKSLLVFDGKKFAAWGDGKLEIKPDQITFISSEVGEGIFALRNMTIDRSSGHISDAISISMGGSSKFEGECKPVSEPQPLSKKF